MKSIVAATHYRRRRLYEKQLLIVDGYNMIGAWPELVQLKKQERLEDARELLLVVCPITPNMKGWKSLWSLMPN